MTDTGYTMPPEWHSHARTWMAFPCAPYVTGDSLERAASKWAEVANVIAKYEPVVMLVDPASIQEAARLLGSRVRTIERRLDDSWMRDIGPTFVRDGVGTLGAVDWIFNGWGQQEWATWSHDATVAGSVAESASATLIESTMVNEGGAIHVDGTGSLLATETVQLDPLRNPGWTAAQVEAEFRRVLGVRNVVWLPRGLTADYGEFGTRGHVDMVAAFVAPGVCVVHNQRDPMHPDFEVSQETLGILHASGIETVCIDAPAMPLEADLVDWSYVNFYVGNGFVLVGTFDHDDDVAAIETLGGLFPGRTIECVDARLVFESGGGLHCITQQEPSTGS